MHASDVLDNPVRRRILELLAGSERTSGSLMEAVPRESDISQPRRARDGHCLGKRERRERVRQGSGDPASLPERRRRW
jgi:hypothetical protein